MILSVILPASQISRYRGDLRIWFLGASRGSLQRLGHLQLLRLRALGLRGGDGGQWEGKSSTPGGKAHESSMFGVQFLWFLDKIDKMFKPIQ